jgi:hypothetical protein
VNILHNRVLPSAVATLVGGTALVFMDILAGIEVALKPD